MGRNDFDVVVIGGGVAGLSAALMAARSRRTVLVVDAGETRNRFAAHMHGVLGNEGTAPADLVARGRAEIARYGAEVEVQRVVGVAGPPEGPMVVTGESGDRWIARAVVVASGVGDGLPDVPGLADRWGSTVLHCPYCHGWEVRDRALGVLATSAAGLHQVEMVRQLSDRVVLFLAPEVSLDDSGRRRLESRGVRIVRTPVVEVVGAAPAIDGVRLADGTLEPVEALFAIGTPVLHEEFLQGLALERQDGPWGNFPAVDAFGRTSHPRVWAAGNVTNPMANVPISIGAGTAAGAAVNGALVAEDFDLAAAATAPA